MVKKSVTLLVIICFATAAWAGPKDKTKGALVNPSACKGIATWNNAIVKTKYQADSKQVKISWKDTTISDGTTVYCFLDANTYISALGGATANGNTVVFKGTVTGGKLGIKGKLGTILSYQPTETLSINSTTECYLDTTGGTYSPSTQCAAGAGLWLAQDTANYNDDGLEGVCQGFTPAMPISTYPDASPIAVAGTGSFPPDATTHCP